MALDRRIRQLESNLVGENVDPMSLPIPADDLAVMESLECVQREHPDTDFREALEMAVARGLESRGYSTAQIAEELPVWMESFESVTSDTTDRMEEREFGREIP